MRFNAQKASPRSLYQPPEKTPPLALSNPIIAGKNQVIEKAGSKLTDAAFDVGITFAHEDDFVSTAPFAATPSDTGQNSIVVPIVHVDLDATEVTKPLGYKCISELRFQ
tara:strand:+ start:1981 stop:2307 length:327 start_codon:yes stop_codon:yes gene_type:complete